MKLKYPPKLPGLRYIDEKTKGRERRAKEKGRRMTTTGSDRTINACHKLSSTFCFYISFREKFLSNMNHKM